MLTRFLRFRLRTLLIACAAFGALLALYVIPVYQQRQAVAALMARGASVYYSHQLNEDGDPKFQFRMCGFSVEPEPSPWYHISMGLDFTDHVSAVYLFLDDKISARDLAQLKFLRRLEHLHLTDSAITDDCLRHLSSLRTLRRLSLYDTKTTDQGVQHLSSLRNLEELSLRETNVSSACFVHLANLTELRELNLYGTKVDGSGIMQLASLTNLQSLNLVATKVDPEDIIRLEQALPYCRIEWDGAVPDAVKLGGVF